MASPVQTRVLIAGAGPAGLALAIELGMRGIPCLLIERNDRVGHAPRAKTTHIRTREHMRRWGIAAELAAASPFGTHYPSNVVFATRLGGHLLARIPNAFNCDPAPDPRYSEHAQWIPQYRVEEVLRRHAATLPSVQIRFRCAFERFEQRDDKVTSTLRDLDSDQVFEVESDYLVGADGARSLIRELIGARFEGQYGLSRNFNIVFRAPGLAAAHALGPAIMYWQINADAPSLIGPMDSGDRWFFMPTAVPEGLRLGTQEAADLIRRATGIDLPYEILSTDEWVASQFIADRYRRERVFLVGDACHLHPPFGGYGMNMGIADSVDLGWKLAAVLQGWGGDALLESYQRERRPLHRQVIDEAVRNHKTLGNHLLRPGLEEDSPAGEKLRAEVGAQIQAAKTREFKSIGVVLGYCYADSPVIASEAGGPLPLASEYVPTARPGCVAPHQWLAQNQSLYDLFGEGFTLLVFDPGLGGEAARATGDAHATGTPLKVIKLANPALAALYEAPMALIRPDQHVAWRGAHWPGKGLLMQVCGRAGTAAGAQQEHRAAG
ncbi:MAG: FAD-dependent monooxygenase [Steroidobacteraceae bacterium]